VVAIIPAAGLSTRMSHAAAFAGEAAKPALQPRKPFLLLDNTPILIHTLRKFVASPAIHSIYVALRPEDGTTFLPYLQAESFSKSIELVEGGEYRQGSVENCLRRVPPDTDLVAVHDAVRPFVELEAISRVIEEAARTGAAILGIPPVDTVKQVERTQIRATLPRERIVLAQTPQVFRYELLRRAYQHAEQEGFLGTDEASMVEHLGVEVSVVLGSDRNIKITKPSDLELARLFQAEERARVKP
jgi:2-C-methyl-D-erythritol 4-phosphate cytidylyltransferase